MVPAHAGGVDLSFVIQCCHAHDSVPAHAGGVDLSNEEINVQVLREVPAHAGGVDLSQCLSYRFLPVESPRPCGRGGFKQHPGPSDMGRIVSPPMRAGWI